MCKEDTRRRGGTMRSGWRCCSYPIINQRQETVIVSVSGGEVMERFVEKYLPQHREMIGWVPGLEYSLRKRGRWRTLNNVAAAWREQNDELAEEVYDMVVVDACNRKPMWYSEQRGYRKLFTNQREVNTETKSQNLTPTPRKVEQKKSKRKNQSNINFSDLFHDKTNFVKMTIFSKSGGYRENQNEIPLKCHASDKYTRKNVQENLQKRIRRKNLKQQGQTFYFDEEMEYFDVLPGFVKRGKRKITVDKTLFLSNISKR